MKYCNFCFDDLNIQEFIQEYGEKVSDNHVCENEDCTSDLCTHIIDHDELSEWMISIVNKVYCYNEETAYSVSRVLEGSETIRDYSPFRNLYEICGELFGDQSDKFVSILCSDELHWDEFIDGASRSGFCSPENEFWLPVCWYDHGHEYISWEQFSKKIKHSLRFFDDRTFNRVEELNKLLPMFEKLGEFKITNSICYRARGVTLEEISMIESNPEKELGIAPPKVAGHNRFSPSGISYIYLAFDEKTAYYEVLVEDKEIYYGSLWHLDINARLLDLREISLLKIKDNYCNPFKNYELYFACGIRVLHSFLRDIQREIEQKDKSLEYLPTQVLAEFIRLQGYDGFVFESTKNMFGTNIVLFQDNLLSYTDFWKYYIEGDG